MRDALRFMRLDLLGVLRARSARAGLVLTLGALALALALAPGSAALAGLWFAGVVGGLALLLAAAGGGFLPADRLEGRASWIVTLAPSPATRRTGAALAAAALALGGAVLVALAIGALAPPLGLARETFAAREIPLGRPLEVRRARAGEPAPTVTLDLGEAVGAQSRVVFETRLRGLALRGAGAGATAPGPTGVAYAAGAATGRVIVPWRARLEVPLPDGARELRLFLADGEHDLALTRGWVLGAPQPFLLSWLWAGLLLGLAGACVAPLAVALSRATSGPTAAGATVVLALVAGMRAVLPELEFVDATDLVHRAARSILELALALAPDIRGLACAAEPAAGRALGPACLAALAPLLPYALAWAFLLWLPASFGRSEEQA